MEKELQALLKVPVYHYSRLDSTSDYLRSLALRGAQEGTVVLADQQSKGRGRRGQGWFSPPGGLYFSVLFKPGDLSMEGFSLVLALSVIKGLKVEGGEELLIKWPNDLFLERKKIAGILCEKFSDNLIVGLGINIFNEPQEWPKDLIHKAGVLTNPHDGLVELFASLYSSISASYIDFCKHGFLFFKEALEKASLLLGKHVRLDNGQSGLVLGYSENGALEIKDEKGERQSFSSARILEFS